MEGVPGKVSAFIDAPIGPGGDDEREQLIVEISGLIENGTSSLLNVIEALGKTLTSEDPLIRARGVELLTALVKKTSLPTRTIPTLSQFYLSRLHDHQSVPALLEGLEAILKSDKTTKTQAVAIPVHILENFNVQSYNQAVRQRCYQILQYAVDKYIPELVKHPQFVPGFITAFEGEKDPRNLLLGFKLIRDIVHSFDIEHYTEDLFELLFSYFPITFRPPPDDVIGITAEDLKTSLRDCLRSTSAFAPYAMPSLVEKLGTSSGPAKRDSVEMISACAPVYGMAAVSPHIENIWELLKDDVEKAQDDSTEQKNALFCVKSILSTLSANPAQTSSNPLEKMLKMVVTDCLTHTKEPESKLARTGAKIIVACASSSDTAFSYTTQTAIPEITKLLHAETDPKRKKLYLEIIGDLIAAGIPLYKSGDSEMSNPLLQYKDSFVDLISKALTQDVDHHSSAGPAIRAATSFVESGLADREERSSFYNQLHHALLKSDDSMVREESLAAVVKLSKLDSELATKQTLPLLLTSLRSSEDLEWPLHCVKEMTLHHPTAASDIVRTLVANIATVRPKVEGGQSVEGEEEALQLLSTLLAIIDGVATLPDGGASSFMSSLPSLVVYPLWGECFSSVAGGAESGGVFAKLALPSVSSITSSVVRNLPVADQDALLQTCFKVFVDGDATPLGLSAGVSPLSHGSPTNVTLLSVLFASVVISLRKEATLPVSDRDSFIENLFREASAAESPILTVSLAKAIASLVNKLYDDSTIKTMATREADNAFDKIASAQGTDIERRRLMILLIWLVRATAARSLSTNVDRIAKLLDDPVVGTQAAEAFTLFTSDKELAVSKPNHGVIKPLYKQKVFNFALPLVLEGCKSNSDPQSKANHLVALSNLLADAPQTLLMSQLPKVFTLLLESLSVNNAQLKLLAVGFLQTVATQAPSTVAEHASSAVSRLVALLEPSGSNTEAVRAAALQALAAIAQNVSYEHLHPVKPSVLRALDKASDDKRKVIRKEATITMARWTNVSA